MLHTPINKIMGVLRSFRDFSLSSLSRSPMQKGFISKRIVGMNMSNGASPSEIQRRATKFERII